MRIALVSEHASPLAAVGEVDLGGQNVHVAELAAGLTRSGHEVVVYTRGDDPDRPAVRTAPAGYAVVHLPAGPVGPLPKDDLWPHMPEFALALRRWFSARPPDVVHAHFWMSGWAAATALGRSDVPLVVTYHALGTVKRRHQAAADTSPADRLLVERTVADRADVVIATCSDEVAELHRMGVTDTRIEVVPCGVDVEAFRPDDRGAARTGPIGTGRAHGLGDLQRDHRGPRDPGPRGRRRRPRVLSVGRLVPRKGYDALVAALPSLPQLELIIAGGPPAAQLDGDPECTRLRAQARALGVGDRVRFAGQVPRSRLPALLRSVDLVACTPWYEPFGLVPLEAMACARPVVATAVGGLADTVRSGRTGLLVPPRDGTALVAALGRLLDDPLTAAAMGRRGRRLVERCYAWPVVTAATEAVYRSLVPARGTAPVVSAS